MTRILHCGDRQIGVGRALERQPGDRLRDQEQVGERIVDLALERGVDLLIDGGDVFEGPEVTDEHREAYMRPLERLGGAVPILAVLGNGRHDRSAKPANALQTLRHIPGFQAASRPDVYVLAGVAVAALPHVSTAHLRALYGGGDTDEINATAADLALQVAQNLYVECELLAPDLPRVLVPHWSISGASVPNGLPVDTMSTVVLPLDDLAAIGYDAILASHIHVPQWAALDLPEQGWRVAHPDGMVMDWPVAVYSGSPMPHDFGEENHPHGVWIVDVERGSSRAEFVPIESRRFVTIAFDLTDADVFPPACNSDEMIVALDDFNVEDAIVRFRYRATAEQARRIDMARVCSALMAAGAHVVKLDPKTIHESRARVTDVERPDELTDAEWLDRWLDLTDTPADAAADVRAVFATYLEGAAA